MGLRAAAFHGQARMVPDGVKRDWATLLTMARPFERCEQGTETRKPGCLRKFLLVIDLMGESQVSVDDAKDNSQDQLLATIVVRLDEGYGIGITRSPDSKPVIAVPSL